MAVTPLLLGVALLAAPPPQPDKIHPPREGPQVSLGLGVGAVISDGANRFGRDGYVTNGRLDVTLAQGLNDYVSIGVAAHYTPRFDPRFLSSQGVAARVAVFPWRGLVLWVSPGVDWVPTLTRDAYTVAPGAYGAIGWEWRLGKRLGLMFDVALNLRGVPQDGGVVVGGFNRLSLTWYRK